MPPRISIRDFVRPSVCWSVGPSVMVIELKNANRRIFEATIVIICVHECVWGRRGCGWGLDAHAHPSATILWPRVTCWIYCRSVTFQLSPAGCIWLSLALLIFKVKRKSSSRSCHFAHRILLRHTFNEFIESLCANKFAYLFLYHSRRRSTLTSCALFPSLAKACTGVTAWRSRNSSSLACLRSPPTPR